MFRVHAYLLPCLIAAGLAVVAFLLAAFGLKEVAILSPSRMAPFSNAIKDLTNYFTKTRSYEFDGRPHSR
jgi:hypothetical protein